MRPPTLSASLLALCLLIPIPVLASSQPASAGFGFPDPPEIPFAEAIIDTGRSYSVLAGGGMDGLAPDEEIVDISLTAWIGEQDCGDRDDPGGWPNGPIVLNAVAPWNLPGDPFMSRSVFVSDDFAGKLLCIDQGLGITTPNAYFRLWGPPAVYLLRPPPQPAPDPEPEPAPQAEPSSEPEPAPAVEPEPENTPAREDDGVSSEEVAPDDTPEPESAELAEPEETEQEVDLGAEAQGVAPIGAEGVVLDDVNQADGQIAVDDASYPARTLSGIIRSGSPVVVIGVVDGVAIVEEVPGQPALTWWMLTAGLIGLAAVLSTGVWWILRARRKRHTAEWKDAPTGADDSSADTSGPPNDPESPAHQPAD